MADHFRAAIDWDGVKEQIYRAGRLLEEDSEAALERQQQQLHLRALAVAQPPVPDLAADGHKEYFCFRIGETRFAVSSSEPVSAVRLREDWLLPGMPAVMPGLIHYHGDLIAAVDLRRLLHIEAGEPTMAVIASTGANMMGLLTHEVEGARMLPAQSFSAVPAHLGEACQRFVYAVSSGMTLLLDLHEICQFVRLLELH